MLGAKFRDHLGVGLPGGCGQKRRSCCGGGDAAVDGDNAVAGDAVVADPDRIAETADRIHRRKRRDPVVVDLVADPAADPAVVVAARLGIRRNRLHLVGSMSVERSVIEERHPEIVVADAAAAAADGVAAVDRIG